MIAAELLDQRDVDFGVLRRSAEPHLPRAPVELELDGDEHQGRDPVHGPAGRLGPPEEPERDERGVRAPLLEVVAG